MNKQTSGTIIGQAIGYGISAYVFFVLPVQAVKFVFRKLFK